MLLSLVTLVMQMRAGLQPVVGEHTGSQSDRHPNEPVE